LNYLSTVSIEWLKSKQSSVQIKIYHGLQCLLLTLKKDT